jgi:hypothetical protein
MDLETPPPMPNKPTDRWYGTGKVFALAYVNAITLGEAGEWARDV